MNKRFIQLSIKTLRIYILEKLNILQNCVKECQTTSPQEEEV